MKEVRRNGTDARQMTGQERRKWNEGYKRKGDMGNGNEVMG